MGTTTGTKWVQGYGEGMADILAKVRENVGRTDRTALDAVLLWVYDNSRGETAALASDSIATRADDPETVRAAWVGANDLHGGVVTAAPSYAANAETERATRTGRFAPENDAAPYSVANATDTPAAFLDAYAVARDASDGPAMNAALDAAHDAAAPLIDVDIALAIDIATNAPRFDDEAWCAGRNQPDARVAATYAADDAEWHRRAGAYDAEDVLARNARIRSPQVLRPMPALDEY